MQLYSFLNVEFLKYSYKCVAVSSLNKNIMFSTLVWVFVYYIVYYAELYN